MGRCHDPGPWINRRGWSCLGPGVGNVGGDALGEETTGRCPGPVRDNAGAFLALATFCSQTWRGLCQETTYDLVLPMLQILSMPRKYPPQ